MNESNLWTWLRDIVLPSGHFSRIESANTAPGFPDVHYQIGQYVTGTIELKYQGRNLKVPFTDSKRGLRESQLRWIKTNLKYWGSIWIIAEAVPDIFVIHGSEAEEFNGSTRENLHKISVAVLNRDDPEKAAKDLHNLLTTYRYDK
jgi:hypothetical protein